MTRTGKTTALLATGAAMLTVAAVSAVALDWASEGRDAARTGRTTVTAAQEAAPATGWPVLNSGTTGPPAVAATSNTVYLASAFGNTVRAYRANGALRWAFRRNPQSVLRFFAPPSVGSDGTIYTAGANGSGTDSTVYAIRPDGTMLWQSATISDPHVAIDGAIVPTSTGRVYVRSGTKLTALAAGDGSTVFSVAVPTSGTASPSMALASDGSIYTAGSNEPSGNGGELVKLDATGTTVWTRPVGRSPRIAVRDDGTVLVAQNVTQTPPLSARLTAFSPAGATLWNATFPAAVGSVSAPAVATDGSAYVGASDGTVRAVRPDGTTAWTFAAPPGVDRHRPAIGGDGVVYVSATATLLALTPTGALKWSAPTAGGPLAIGVNGTAYVSSPGKVFAFSGPGARPVVSGLAATPASFRVRGVGLAAAGTSLRFTLNRSATVTFTVRRVGSSPVVGRILVDRTTGISGTMDVGFDAVEGPNTVRFDGRVFRPGTSPTLTMLAPGRYRVTAVAQGPTGPPGTTSTTIRILAGGGAIPLNN